MGRTRIGNAVKIHHLTDIHVGPLHHTVSHKIPFVPSDAKGYQHLDYYLAHLRARSPSDLPDLVIISGDLTSYAAEDGSTAPWCKSSKSTRCSSAGPGTSSVFILSPATMTWIGRGINTKKKAEDSSRFAQHSTQLHGRATRRSMLTCLL